MSKPNEEIFDAASTLWEFWQAGGTWSMDQYVHYLLAWERKQKEVVS